MKLSPPSVARSTPLVTHAKYQFSAVVQLASGGNGAETLRFSMCCEAIPGTSSITPFEYSQL
jgi:hypothetical protein